ncbi:MAG TPA: 30S ribosomal protein S6 [Anaerolineae bacterium]|nr:30S ribosomal protein S6 [Anaerolineae bacterium]
MREYELYLVIDADVADEAAAAIVDRVTSLVVAGYEGTGGEVVKVEARGKRRLTYAIKRRVESQDIVLTFRTPPRALPEIERVLTLDEQVLRYLVVRLDED